MVMDTVKSPEHLITDRKFFSHKLTMWFTLAMVLPVIIFSIVNYRFSRERMVERQEHLLATLSKSLADDIDKYLIGNQNAIDYIGNSERLKLFLQDPEKSAETCREITEWLERHAKVSRNTLALFLLDIDGECLASTEKRLLGMNYSVRRYFQNAIQGYKYKSDWSIGLTTGEAGVFLSRPILDKSQVVGVLVLKMGLDHIKHTVDVWKSHGMGAFLLNENGIILCHTENDLAYHSLKPLSLEEEDAINEDRQFADRPIDSLDLPVLYSAFKKTLQRNAPKFVNYLFNGNKKVAMLTRLHEQDWVVAVSIQYAVIESDANVILRNTLIFLLVMILVAIGTGFLVARTVTRPLVSLTAQVNRFTEGRTYVPVEVIERNEIGLLALSFQHMAKTIMAHTSHLEEKVRLRTLKLEHLSTRLQEELKRQQLTAEALRESEEQFRLIAENVNAVIWTIDATTFRPTYISPYIQQQRGYTVEEAMSQSLSESLTRESFAKIMTLVRENAVHFARREPLFQIPVLELDQPCKNGRIISTEVKISIIRDASGKIRKFVGISWDISDRKAEKAKLTYLSHHDTLTGLNNRAFFDMKKMAPERRFPIGIISADLDGLKYINDTMGHDAGDQLIQSAAIILRMAFRGDDIIARIGGDEFSVLLYHMDEEGIAKALARIQSCEELYNRQHPGLAVRLSAGGAIAQTPGDVLDAIKNADAAMYVNKRKRKPDGGGSDQMENLTKEC